MNKKSRKTLRKTSKERILDVVETLDNSVPGKFRTCGDISVAMGFFDTHIYNATNSLVRGGIKNIDIIILLRTSLRRHGFVLQSIEKALVEWGIGLDGSGVKYPHTEKLASLAFKKEEKAVAHEVKNEVETKGEITLDKTAAQDMFLLFMKLKKEDREKILQLVALFEGLSAA